MSIRVKTLALAISEAKRFLEIAEQAKLMAGHSEWADKKNDPWYSGGQYCAAVKRASMDLSRALAGVRRGGG